MLSSVSSAGCDGRPEYDSVVVVLGEAYPIERKAVGIDLYEVVPDCHEQYINPKKTLQEDKLLRKSCYMKCRLVRGKARAKTGRKRGIVIGCTQSSINFGLHF